MNARAKLVLGGIIAAMLAIGTVVYLKREPRPPVQVVIHLSVRPAGKVEFVLEHANSARFKYVLGKLANTKPYLAQKLKFTHVPDSAVLIATVGVQNHEEAEAYTKALVAALRDFCGREVIINPEKQQVK